MPLQAKCLLRIGLPLPENARLVLLQADKLKGFYSQLDYALAERERVVGLPGGRCGRDTTGRRREQLLAVPAVMVFHGWHEEREYCNGCEGGCGHNYGLSWLA